MRIQLVSDLHLEFGEIYDIKNAGADVLVLAGDICMAHEYSKAPLKCDLDMFFDRVTSEFEHVVYVMGNHEHYKYLFNETESFLRNTLSKYANLHLLQNSCVTIKGHKFIGATMWTDLNHSCPVTDSVLRMGMSDYKVIKYKDNKGNYFKISPLITQREHFISRMYFEEEIKRTYEPIVAVTHHAPSYMSVHEKYKKDIHMNGGYASDLSHLMSDQIKLWCHGHMHDSFDYTINNTRVVCNPVGYPGERRGEFKLDYVVEI